MTAEREYATGIPLHTSKGSSLDESRRLEREVDHFITLRDMADRRLVAIAKTQFELAFMALNKAIVKGDG